MAGLIAWLVVIGGLLATLSGGFLYVKHLGAVEERAEWKPKLEKAVERATTAETANLTLQYDLNNLAKACKESQVSIDGFKRQQDAALRASRDLLRRFEAMEAAQDARAAELRRIIAAPNEGNDCAETDRILRDGARKRVRDAAAEPAK